MDYRVLSRILGLLLMLLAAAMLACLVFAVADKELHPETHEAIRAFSISTAVSLVVALALYSLGRKPEDALLRKEAVAIVGLGWALCALVGSLPYMLCEPALPPVAAFFESMSGFTTTGSTVIDELGEYPPSVLLWRSLTQWLGGMGILVLFVAVLSFLGVGSKSIFRHESSGYGAGGFKARIRETAMTLWRIYLLLTLLCAAGLMALGMSAYDALNHAFTAISTGGFSPRDQSIAYYGSLRIELWLTLFMALGGCSFMLFAWLLRGRLERWRSEEENKLYLALLALAFLVVTAGLTLTRTIDSPGEAARLAVFQVVSLMTTTGYVSADYDSWPQALKALLLALMFIGGCAGSTAGGIKVGRVLLFFRIARAELVSAFRPVRVIPLRLNGRVAHEDVRPQTLFFIAFSGFLLAAGTLLVSAFEPRFDLASSFSAAVAALFNIGPGLGMVGPTATFSGLQPQTHLLLCLLMLLGRLELFAVLVLFIPSLWRKY